MVTADSIPANNLNGGCRYGTHGKWPNAEKMIKDTIVSLCSVSTSSSTTSRVVGSSSDYSADSRSVVLSLPSFSCSQRLKKSAEKANTDRIAAAKKEAIA